MNSPAGQSNRPKSSVSSPSPQENQEEPVNVSFQGLILHSATFPDGPGYIHQGNVRSAVTSNRPKISL
jgi:hypothetical protein